MPAKYLASSVSALLLIGSCLLALLSSVLLPRFSDSSWSKRTSSDEKMAAATANLLKCLVVQPASGSAPTASVIFAHGLVDSGAGWYDVAQMLSRRPGLAHVRFILPNAPIVPVTLNMGMKMPSWFDITSLDELSAGEDAAGLKKSAEALRALARNESAGADKVPASRIVFGGFSQGGAISYLAGLSAYAQEPREPVAGIMALSTWCPLRKEVSGWFEKLNASANGNGAPAARDPLPVFAAHGEADPVVQFRYGERSAELLREGLGLGGFRQISDGPNKGRYTGLRFESYPGMPHSACPEEIEHMGEWLEKVIPASK